MYVPEICVPTIFETKLLNKRQTNNACAGYITPAKQAREHPVYLRTTQRIRHVKLK